MVKLAVVGKDVSKSLSPEMHRFILESLGEKCSYEKVSLPREKFSANAEELFLRYDGFNVTIPFKEEVLPFLNELKGDAGVFGAVNTVVCRTRTGFNTDGAGFSAMLSDAGISLSDKRALILGVGGAGKSCIYALRREGASVYAYAKNEERLERAFREYGDFTPLKEISDLRYDLVINCTGVGMHDTVGQTPFVRDTEGNDALLRLIENCDTAVDLIYEPRESEFLRLAKKQGKRVLNGEAMLFFQAYAADCIFTDRSPDEERARKLWDNYRREL